METGTGKTYVYTKTMLELNKHYGWSKFIIVVPSLAIREGVYKSLQNTEQHFFEQYGKTMHYFIYDSKRLNELDSFSQSNDINVMIINMQAFNASMKEGGRSKDARIIFSERDEFGSRRPIDVVAANNPIIITDEPQKMGNKTSKTQKGIALFNPLFVLGYSATHREKHDLVYSLDALDAFNQRLVKRIEVKGFKLKNMRGTDAYLYLKDIVVSKNKAPEAVIEFKQMGANGTIRKRTQHFVEGDDIYLATKEPYLEAYKDYVIASGNDGVVPSQDGKNGYVRFLNGVTIQIGEAINDSSAHALQRLQIREAISTHLQKEEALFKRGIKCLSLFFIDSVAKYRDIHAENGITGYGTIFEEEYAALVQERIDNPTIKDKLDGSFIQYLKRDSSSDVHSGYFSIDSNGKVAETKESNAERKNGLGRNDDDAQRGYDLILKDKERLLSFEEPVRFIFSHSALREGWDNPNIFQICTLKDSGSETSKRQEVGRGMRLCVDNEGNRQDLGTLGESDIHRVNVLTVIASESYEEFVADLQRDISSTLRDRPTVVEADFFEGRNIYIENEKICFNADNSKQLYKVLIRKNLIDDDDKPSQLCIEMINDGTFCEFAAVHFPEDLKEEKQVKAVEVLLQSVYDPSVLNKMIQPAHEKLTENKMTDNFEKREFQELWKRINKKHAYTVSFDDTQLQEKAIDSINKDLAVNKLAYTLTSGVQKEKAHKEELEAKSSFQVKKSTTHDVNITNAIEVSYDLVGEVAQAAAITRKSAATILAGIEKNVFDLFKINPEEFIIKVAKLIVNQKATMIVDCITYHEINQEYDSAIFTTNMPENIANAYEAEKNIQEYVFPDSEGERTFAQALDVANEVVVYAKLPRSFQIPTPVGNYAPDWAIAFKEGSVKHIFFIAETKGTMDTMQLSTVEQTKIACAKKLFNEMSSSQVRYHNVTTYKVLLNVMGNIK